jgi:hypothetical protein
VVLKIQTIESETVAKALLELHKKTKGLAYMNLMRSSKSELIKNTKPVRGAQVFLHLIYFNCPKMKLFLSLITICYNAVF